MSTTTIKNQPVEKTTTAQMLIEQRCLEIIQEFNNRSLPISLSDFKTFLFRCLHDAYVLQAGAVVREQEVETMHSLWKILGEIEGLNKMLEQGVERRLCEIKAFEIVRMFSDRSRIPVGIQEFKSLIFYCLHDAYSMVEEATVREDELTTMYNLWQILLDIEGLTQETSKPAAPESEPEGDPTELQRLRERCSELDTKCAVFLEVIGLVGNGCVDGEKLLHAAQKQILEQSKTKS